MIADNFMEEFKMEMKSKEIREVSAIEELNSSEMDLVSGGNPVVIATAALIGLGNSALDFGRNLGATAYRICH
jgi:hypothetical protein